MEYLIYLAVFCYISAFFEKRLIYGGFLSEIAYLFLRALKAGRLPVTGPHDTLILFGAFTGLSIIVFEYFSVRERMAYVLTGILGAGLSSASLFFEPLNAPLPPVLRTFWFEFHVITAFLSYALFGTGLVSGAVYLVKKIDLYEEIQYKSILTGYSLFSASMIGGGIWAFYAWGSYWLWTPKELWTTLLWLFYSLYLHLRLKGQRRERINVIMGITGFGVVLFTYLGVSLLMKSSHSF